MTVELYEANKRSLSDIKWIVVHHSGTDSGNVNVFRDYHVHKLGWEDVGYHFVICNGNGGGDGEVQPGRPLEKVGAHAYGMNYQSIGICLVGNFNSYEPTQKQWTALVGLCSRLMYQLNIAPSHVIGHKEVPLYAPNAPSTDCPGSKFPLAKLRQELSGVRSDYAGHWAEKAIRQALSLGLLQGYPDGTFRPDQAVTRAELAVALVSIYNTLKR